MMEPREDLPELFTTADVVRISKSSKATVKRWIRSGKLRTVKIGRLRRVWPEDLLEFLAERTDAWADLRDHVSDHECGG